MKCSYSWSQSFKNDLLVKFISQTFSSMSRMNIIIKIFWYAVKILDNFFIFVYQSYNIELARRNCIDEGQKNVLYLSFFKWKDDFF